MSKGKDMRSRIQQRQSWARYGLLLGLGGCLWYSGYLAAQWQGQSLTGLLRNAQAQEAPQQTHHGTHNHAAHEDLAPFMMRNAYHFSTLYHAGRAARWELAAYQVEELAENLDDAAEAAPSHGAALRDYKKDFLQPLSQAVETRQTQQFSTAFQAAVHGCNDCHKAHQRAYIVIPEAPPNLSIFTLTPASEPAPGRPAAPKNDVPNTHQGHKH